MSTRTDDATDEPTDEPTGRVPAALALLPPTRTHIWLYLRERGEPATAEEVIDELGLAETTVYRAARELEERGLAERRIRVCEPERGSNQRAAWIATDGGGDE